MNGRYLLVTALAVVACKEPSSSTKAVQVTSDHLSDNHHSEHDRPYIVFSTHALVIPVPDANEQDVANRNGRATVMIRRCEPSRQPVTWGPSDLYLYVSNIRRDLEAGVAKLISTMGISWERNGRNPLEVLVEQEEPKKNLVKRLKKVASILEATPDRDYPLSLPSTSEVGFCESDSFHQSVNGEAYVKSVVSNLAKLVGPYRPGLSRLELRTKLLEINDDSDVTELLAAVKLIFGNVGLVNTRALHTRIQHQLPNGVPITILEMIFKKLAESLDLPRPQTSDPVPMQPEASSSPTAQTSEVGEDFSPIVGPALSTDEGDQPPEGILPATIGEERVTRPD